MESQQKQIVTSRISYNLMIEDNSGTLVKMSDYPRK